MAKIIVRSNPILQANGAFILRKTRAKINQIMGVKAKIKVNMDIICTSFFKYRLFHSFILQFNYICK